MNEEFEKYAKDGPFYLPTTKDNDGRYSSLETHIAFGAWQASRKQTIEECAVKAEDTICECCWAEREVEAAQEIAFHIRALQQQ